MFNNRLVLFALSLTFSAISWSSVTDIESSDPAIKALAIAKEQVRRNDGWIDSKAKFNMVLRNRRGDESIRQVEINSLEGATGGDKSLLVFNKPLDVKGTALLTHSHIEESDDQWIYLPALKRVKRISSKNKSGPFMGSEFSYEDLSSFEHEKYTYLYLQDETLNGALCYVVEQYPVDKYSGYTKRIVWIDQSEFRVQKIDFYDRKQSLFKTLQMVDYDQYLGKYWRPRLSMMTNHQTGKSTELIWSDYAFNVELDTGDFKQNSLKRHR